MVPIKTIASLLAILAASCYMMDRPVNATSKASVVRTVGTTPDLALRNATFRILTTGSVTSQGALTKPQDAFRILVQGIQLQSGDCVSFSMDGADGTVELGSPTFTGSNPCLTLIGRSAKGALNEAPNVFPEARLRFNPGRSRISFFSGRGSALSTPVLSALGTTENNVIDVNVHVRRPGDTDNTFTFTGLFQIRHSLQRRTQLHTYRGQAR